ncbi:MAG: type I DNA topoisomerase [Blastocatellia bacterium]|nr:type I DNA topoisomerase [Blastocatellia bacterium]
MAKNLVVVESPAKAKTINKYLGRDYRVMASIGHIKDLPANEFGVDIANNFQPTYEIIPDSRKRNNSKTIKHLKEAAEQAEAIYLAADPDREGEAICQHLKEVLVGPNDPKPVYRVQFNEITQSAVRRAFEHPGQINQHRVDAQQARRVLDRLVGYQVSPLLWKKVRRGLSAGRVQSVALRLVVEREREIQAFVPTEYWTLEANLSAALPPPFVARLVGGRAEDGNTWSLKTSEFDKPLKANEVHVKTEEEMKHIVSAVQHAEFKVVSVETKEKKRNPVPPFITSKLQQEASRKLRFPVAKTMKLAQKLYEGVDIGEEGTVGLITYMRTDSTRISETALDEVRAFVRQQYGDQYVPDKPMVYRSKEGAQEAHEAIRPTSVARTPERLKPYLSKDELALYQLIWQRFVASQMKPAVFDQTIIEIEAGDYLFRATGSVLKFAGFLAVYEEGKDEQPKDEEEASVVLPKVAAGDVLTLNELKPEQHMTTPPPRYTEATLVKALEENGVGRPSTYAQILTVIQDREYVQKVKNQFKPTDLGMVVNDLLVESFDDLFNVQYTARMEEELDEVEEGRRQWVTAIREFYEKFEKDLRQAEQKMNNMKKGVASEETCHQCGSPMLLKIGRYGYYLACTNQTCGATRKSAEAQQDGESAESPYEAVTCENCGRPMTLKKGRWGQFLACTGYPECKTTRRIKKDGQLAAADKVLDEKCPECGSPLMLKHGPYGEYIACSRRPACSYIKQDKLGIACPRTNCKGELVRRKSRRGKIFYGCSNYPACDVTLWDKPIKQACPQCGAAFLLEKVTRKQETIHYCYNTDCNYRVSITAGEGVRRDQAVQQEVLGLTGTTN